MGATVITGKTVAAFRHPATGEVIYLLFQQSYEKNCHPHIPNWNCRSIGNITETMKYIFDLAANCEGGSLQTKAGPTKPETYIKGWRVCLSEPFEMADLEITLKLGGKAMYDPIPDTQVESSIAALARIGRQDIIEALQAGPVKVNLHRDVDVIIALYGTGTNLPLWKVIDGLKGIGYANESLAPPVAKRDVAKPSASVYAIDNHNFVGSIGGEPLKHMGYRYMAVSTYLREVACPIELQSSFSAYKLIREFRDLCEAAPELPDDTVITVTPAKTEHSYYLDNAKELAVKLGIVASVEDVPETYETTFGVVRERKEEYLLSTLEDKQVAWMLAPSTDVAMLHGVAAHGEVHQLGLF